MATALVVAVLAGCSSSDSTSSTDAGESSSTSGAQSGPTSGGTLRFGILAEPINPDPHLNSNYSEGIIGINIADKLTYINPETSELEPWLATSWEVSEDLTSFTFELREDVTFSDGTAFNAESVKENFDLLGLGAPDLGVPALSEIVPNYAGSEVLDEYTVRIDFTQPSAAFLRNTAHFNAGLLASSTLALPVEDRGDFSNIVGTGPFTITAHDPQGTTVLTKREGYDWAPPSLEHDGGEAYLDAVELIVIPESQARTGALRSGELDAILDVQPTDEELLAGEGYGITSQLIPGKANSFNILVDKTPTDQWEVRKALQLGWNRQALEEAVLSDSYAVATSIVSTKIDGHVDLSEDYLHYDTEAAAGLLDQAGWTEVGEDGIRIKDGERLVVDVLALDNQVTNRPAFELVQQDLREIGVELNLAILPGSEWRAERENNNQDWNIIQYTQSAVDITVLDEVFSPARTNLSKISEDFAGYDELIEKLDLLNTTLDPELRAQYGAEAQELVVDTYALSSPIFNTAQIVASAPDTHGIGFDVMARNVFYGAWIG